MVENQRNIKRIKQRHCDPKTIRIKLDTSDQAVNDEENMSVFNPNLVQGFDGHNEIDMEILDKLKQCETFHNLDEITTRDEFDSRVTYLTNY